MEHTQSGIDIKTGELITGFYRIVFGKDYLFIEGKGIVQIKKGSLKEL